jgi:prepilin-type N-terminal cleavage/methylation domain-containing protein
MRAERRAGFTLIEALAALTLLAAFAGALAPHLSASRRILSASAGRVAASTLLRSLIEASFDRENGVGVGEGEADGFHWRVTAEPMFLDAPVFDDPAPKMEKPPKWAAYRVLATVAWGDGKSLLAETIRLAKAR